FINRQSVYTVIRLYLDEELSLTRLPNSTNNKPISWIMSVDNLFRSLDNQKGPILLVTHGDIVKMFLASAAGLKIDGFQKFVIEPGSISTIGSSRGKYSILGSNTYPAHASKNITTNTIGGGDFLIKQLQWWKK
ncbi:MAG: hypothetical protein EBY71_03875, partial [Actinobacteria bacterium]|nr:hypothetical protein [Actinomycetota bacterium]